MDMEAIRAELALRLKTALDGTKGQTYAYGHGNITAPALVVLGETETEFDSGGFGEGQDSATIVIQAYAGATSEKGAHMLLDKLLESSGANSVKAAIESERPNPVTLGGLVSYARVVSHNGVQFYTLRNGTEYVGTQFLLELST